MSTTVQKLQKSVYSREQRYLQVINNNLPPNLTKVIENNLFTSIYLYTILFLLAITTAIFSRASETDLGQEAKGLAVRAKEVFQEEKAELNQHFKKVLDEANAKLEATKKDAEQKFEEYKKQAEVAAEKAQAELTETKKELVRAQDALLDAKAEHEKSIKSAQAVTDSSHVQVSDLHYQIAEKDKRIHALESVERHLQAELDKEKELHESSKEGLHDAIGKLMEARKQFSASKSSSNSNAALGKTVA